MEHVIFFAVLTSARLIYNYNGNFRNPKLGKCHSTSLKVLYILLVMNESHYYILKFRCRTHFTEVFWLTSGSNYSLIPLWFKVTKSVLSPVFITHKAKFWLSLFLAWKQT